MTLQSKVRTFYKPKRLPQDLHPQMYETFSLTTWVRGTQDSGTAWVIRKLQKNQKTNAKADICWGWRFPSCFAHGRHDAAIDTYVKEPPTQMRCNDEPRPQGLNLEAVILNTTSITFYRNGEILSSQAIDRVVTDCKGDLEIGDVGLQLGDVKYYPNALTTNQLAEIYEDGAPLSQIVNGGSPEPNNLDDFDRLSLQVQDSASTLGFQADSVQEEVLDLQSAASLTVAGAISSIDDILRMEESILNGQQRQNESSPAIASDTGRQTCFTSSTRGVCSWTGDVEPARSLYLIRTTARCGDSAAIAYGGPVTEWNSPSIDLVAVGEATEPVDLYVCAAASAGEPLASHSHLVGTLSIVADDMVRLLDDQATFSQSLGSFSTPDVFGSPSNISMSIWVRQNPDDIGFYVSKLFQPDENSPMQQCWSFRSFGLSDELILEGHTNLEAEFEYVGDCNVVLEVETHSMQTHGDTLHSSCATCGCTD
eukprot:COSAG02_NODE_837_length_16637_cov_5.797859_11_plen_480_part_00